MSQKENALCACGRTCFGAPSAQWIMTAHPAVREAIIEHCPLAPEALTVLASDGDWYVRHAVATHPATPPEALAILASDSNYRVRFAVAQHPATPPEALAILASDRNRDVCSAACAILSDR